ncbi:MAG: MlaD family protein [candidate division KSB1 bacterium]|nr:MlaD family protein [candidate division KSB1 bacterium]MDZ7342184.1 MlaD family protein [candidate division KSB1 bacterium]
MQSYNPKNHATKIGVFSLWGLTLFLILFIVYVIGTNQKLFARKYSLYMFVPNSYGLNSGAFITLSGRKVGVVGKLEFQSRHNQAGIQVELKIDRRYAKMITATSTATIQTMGMLGDKYVDIALGDLRAPVLQPGDYIQANSAPDLSTIVTEAMAAISDLRLTLGRLNQLAGDVANGQGVLGMLIEDRDAKNDLSQVLAQLNQLSQRLNEGSGNVARFIMDSTVFHSVKATAQNLDRLSSKIERGDGTLGRMIADTTLYFNLQSISWLTASLLEQLKQGQGTAGKLLTDEKLYEQLLLLTQSLQALTADVKNNPRKYVTIKIF